MAVGPRNQQDGVVDGHRRQDDTSAPLRGSSRSIYSYTPTKDDLDKYLRVTVTYRDGHCPCSSRKTAQDISDNKVIDEPFMDEPPVFDQDPDKAESTGIV